MSVSMKELIEGMTLTDDKGEWYVSLVDEEGVIWLDPCRDTGYTSPKQIQSNKDLRGFRIK